MAALVAGVRFDIFVVEGDGLAVGSPGREFRVSSSGLHDRSPSPSDYLAIVGFRSAPPCAGAAAAASLAARVAAHAALIDPPPAVRSSLRVAAALTLLRSTVSCPVAMDIAVEDAMDAYMDECLGTAFDRGGLQGCDSLSFVSGLPYALADFEPIRLPATLPDIIGAAMAFHAKASLSGVHTAGRA